MIKLIVISGTVNYDDWGVSDEISLHLDSRCFIPVTVQPMLLFSPSFYSKQNVFTAVSFFQVERFIDSLFDHIP
jgi:hypothetical protein